MGDPHPALEFCPTRFSGRLSFGQHGPVVDPPRRAFGGGVPLDASKLTCSLARLAIDVVLDGWMVNVHLNVAALWHWGLRLGLSLAWAAPSWRLLRVSIPLAAHSWGLVPDVWG